MGRTRRAAKRLAVVTAVPIAAALITVRPGVAQADPRDLPSIGEIISGSAGSDTPGGDPIGAPSGSALGLGTGSNTGGGAATSGSSLGLTPIETAGTAGGGLKLDSGSVSLGSAGAVADPVEEIAVSSGHPIAAPSTLGESLGLQNGSVLTACAGSAAVSVAAILLGLATGSGFGSGLIGYPGLVLGSSGLSGPGSSGAGSVVLGSAVGGSAILTCLLLLPAAVPEAGIPLGFPSAPAVVPASVPVVPEVPAAVPPVQPPPAVIVTPPHRAYVAAEEIPEPVDWSALQMMTVIVLTILAATRAKIGRSRNG